MTTYMEVRRLLALAESWALRRRLPNRRGYMWPTAPIVDALEAFPMFTLDGRELTTVPGKLRAHGIGDAYRVLGQATITTQSAERLCDIVGVYPSQVWPEWDLVHIAGMTVAEYAPELDLTVPADILTTEAA